MQTVYTNRENRICHGGVVQKFGLLVGVSVGLTAMAGSGVEAADMPGF
jgi:hypothetical protein